MNNWRGFIDVVNGQRDELAREARTARMLRDASVSSSKSGGLLWLVALSIILVGLIAVWVS